MRKGIGAGICLFLLLLPAVNSLLFLQDQTDITESYTAEQTTIITLLNDEPRSENIFIQVAPNSQYLLSFIDIEDSTLTLTPGEKKNIRITTQIEEGILSPETHTIDLIARSDDDRSVARTKISFTVPGIAQPELDIISEEFNLEGTEKILSFELENSGNVIMRPQPQIIIMQKGLEVKTIDYKTPIQIMPARTYPLSMRLDTNSLEEGEYQVLVVFNDRDNIQLTSSIQNFEVKNNYEQTRQEQENYLPHIIGGIILLLIGALLAVNILIKKRQDPLSKRIKTLEEKEQKIEKELQRLINKTHHSVNNTNKWIKKHLGEEYELR